MHDCYILLNLHYCYILLHIAHIATCTIATIVHANARLLHIFNFAFLLQFARLLHILLHLHFCYIFTRLLQFARLLHILMHDLLHICTIATCTTATYFQLARLLHARYCYIFVHDCYIFYALTATYLPICYTFARLLHGGRRILKGVGVYAKDDARLLHICTFATYLHAHCYMHDCYIFSTLHFCYMLDCYIPIATSFYWLVKMLHLLFIGFAQLLHVFIGCWYW